MTKESAVPSPAALWRRFADLAFDHATAIGEEIDLPGVRGTIGDDVVSRRLPGSVFLPAEPIASSVVDEVVAAYAAHDAVPPRWFVPDAVVDLDAVLGRYGYATTPFNLLRLRSAAVSSGTPTDTLVLPGRAARASYGTWCDRRAATDAPAGLLPRHLDDPQYEAVIALKSGAAVAAAGLQTRGETTAVFDLFVDPIERRRGLATALLARLIDLAARAQAADVFAGIGVDNTEAIALVDRMGFVVVRTYFVWSIEP